MKVMSPSLEVSWQK